MTFKKGSKIRNTGRTRFKKGEMEFEKNSQWKGNEAGEDAMHKWVYRWKGRPNICEVCGTTNKKFYDWANIDHTYRRVLEDYIRMCRSCHRKYDKNRGVKIN